MLVTLIKFIFTASYTSQTNPESQAILPSSKFFLIANDSKTFVVPSPSFLHSYRPWGKNREFHSVREFISQLMNKNYYDLGIGPYQSAADSVVCNVEIVLNKLVIHFKRLRNKKVEYF